MVHESIVPNDQRARFKLLIFLVYEICEYGKRTLYHHDERRLVDDVNKTTDQTVSSANNQSTSRDEDKDDCRQGPIILSLTDDMFGEHGIDLDLKHKVILQKKTQRKDSRLLFCKLTHEYPAGITYETTRLAFLLVNEKNILWNYLLLSNAMIFPKSTNDIGDIDIRVENNDLIEKIPVRLLKRKIDLNQSELVIKRPPRVKKYQQITAHTHALNSAEIQQSHDQTINTYAEQQTGLPTEQRQQILYITASQYPETRLVRSIKTGFLDS
ncbi:unnamed protein product [Rotaria magnacalcarata]